MFSKSIATSIDYNRGLPLPILWIHVAGAALRPVADALFGWALWPRFRSWAPLTLFALAAVWVLVPQDAGISAAAQHWFGDGGGDVRRELKAIEQFGQGFSMLLIALTIALLDSAQRRRLLDWGIAALILLAATNLLKVLVGRPRPGVGSGDAETIVGPFGAYAVEAGATRDREARDGVEQQLRPGVNAFRGMQRLPY